MSLVVTGRIRKKLIDEHQVSEDEICQCFTNREGRFLEDIRVNNKTTPPTLWFLSETESGRRLKIVFILAEGETIIKSAYEPNQDEIRIYQKFGM